METIGRFNPKKLVSSENWLTRLGIGVAFLVVAIIFFIQTATNWWAQKELTLYGMTIQATVTARFIRQEGSVSDPYYEDVTEYEYTVNGVTYPGSTSNSSAYNSTSAQIQIVYSSRDPSFSRPAGELTPTASFLTWSMDRNGGLPGWILSFVLLIVGGILVLPFCHQMRAALRPNDKTRP